MSTKVTIAVDAEWVELIKICQAVRYGTVQVVIQDGKAVRVDAGVKQMKLGGLETAKDAVSEFETLAIGD